ncbi:MAG TPA: DUF6279 family lipoprotein [Ramlibacter sp.]|jgi:hypothetical protein|nr:DUF6279 family lipoprotein [Ramlibacter sp.]
MRSWDPIRLAGIILVLACSLALSACSAVKLGYNTLPDLAYWWLDGYADFSDTQRAPVRGEIARLHAWHRQQELTRIAELLARMEQLAPGEVTPQQACTVVRDAQERMNAVADRAEPSVVALAPTLTARQLRQMERKFRSSNDTFRKDMIDPPPEQQQEKRLEKMLERLEMIYGRLDEPQRAVLRQGLAQSSYDPVRILGERQRRQQDLLQTLRAIIARPDTPLPEVRTQLRGWLDRALQAPDPAYRAWQQGLVDEGCRVFAAVHRSTTAAQRDQAVRRLRAYQRDLRELAAQPQ